MPTDPEFEVLKDVRGLLKSWKVAQKMLESQSTVTSSLVLFIVTSLQKELDIFIEEASMTPDEDDDEALLAMSVYQCARDMKEDFLKRWGALEKPFHRDVQRGAKRRQVGVHPDFVIAHALDPRFKDLEGINEENKEELWECILEEMLVAKKQEIELQKKVDSGAQSIVHGSPGASRSDESILEEGAVSTNPFAKYTAHTSAASAPVRVDETRSEIERQCKSELLNYRGTNGILAFVGPKMNDPLLWWKQHAGTFPTLWLLASYFLAIPGTSALSERCFSAAGRIFTPSRAGVMSTDSFVECYVIKRNMDLLPSTPQKKQK
jgi:hypothetical protein